MYVDDLVVFAPSVAGLNKLLKLCEQFSVTHDIKFNPKKCVTMSFRSKSIKDSTLPMFTLNGEVLQEVVSTKYLGHYICNDLTDDTDVKRQCRQLYMQANS